MFNNFTSVDRQTELNDDDGSLTGLTNDAGTGSISVNQDQFFAAPVETAECLSNSGIAASGHVQHSSSGRERNPDRQDEPL